MIECFFDGCCEPINPGGTAAYGVVIYKNGEKIWEDSKIVGSGKGISNNVAEYAGFKAILKYLLDHELNKSQIIAYGDSMMVVKQMAGAWRIKAGAYVELALECQDMLRHFPYLVGKWIPREKNYLADELSKKVIKQAGVKFRIQPEA